MVKINENKVACFIHSTHMDVWKHELLYMLLKHIITSGLVNKLDFIYINNIGIPLDSKFICNLHNKIVLENYSRELTLFENYTIRSIHQFSKLHPDYKILYLHTKGVSYQKDHEFVPGILSWIKYMMYCLVEKHEECLQLLDIYDVVGTNFRDKTFEQINPPHYSGNFWWGTTNYMSKLYVDYMIDKYHAEFWLMQQKPLFFNCAILHHLYQVNYPLENYKKQVDSSFQEQLLFCQFGSDGLGLCNQLYSLVNTIIVGKTFPGYSTIIVNDFLTCIDDNTYCSSKEIIDFGKMNTILEPYKVKLVCKEDVEFDVKEVKFGLVPNKVVDITDEAKAKYVNGKMLFIPVGSNINECCKEGDPIPETRKQIYVHYTINGRDFHITYDEVVMVLHHDIVLDFENFTHVTWLSRTGIQHAKHHVSLFHELISKIVFHDKFYSLTTQLSSQLTNKINIIHLRIESDAIEFWANINGIPNELYKNILEQKYIRIIQEHIPRDSMTILLSMSTDNAITKFMKEHNYPYIFMDKTLINGRECNAILDLLVSENCNSVFVGNINPENSHGSTFSYAIYNKLRSKDNVKKICIDTDRVFDKEYVL